MAGTVSYKEAGAALRAVVAAATRLGITRTEWRVLAAVLVATTSYSKHYDSTYVAAIADLAQLDQKDHTKKRTKRALKRLAELRLITYEPAEKHGQRTLIGLPSWIAAGGSGA
jgi:RIO-like serine/threonine protein kinase